MTKKDEMKKSIEDEIKQYDNFFEAEKENAALAASVQERKKEASAKLFFVASIPDDVFEEVGDPLYRLQENDKKKAEIVFGGVKRFTADEQRYITSGTTDTSAYTSIVYTIAKYNSSDDGIYWVEPVENLFSELADEKAKNEYLPKRLNNLQDKLGDIFVIAHQSVEKARAEMLGIDLAAHHMRDVVEQLWGNIVDLAYEVGSNKISQNRLQLKKASHRQKVVEVLAGDENINQLKLTQLLDNLFSLHCDLSMSDFGKNPLTTDMEKLNSLYNRWIFLVDDIVAFINLNVKQLI